MAYDLTAIEGFCRFNDLAFRFESKDEIRVQLIDDLELCFANTDGGEDTHLGFSDSTWHTHGTLILMTGKDTFIELEPVAVLEGLKGNDLLIGSRYLNGELQDRWIFHRTQSQDFRYFQRGESIVIQRGSPIVRLRIR